MGELDLVAIGQNVKRLRKDRHLTQAELARRAFVSRSFISLVESAKTRSSLSSLYAIAAALNVGVEEIIPGTGDVELRRTLREAKEAYERATQAQEDVHRAEAAFDIILRSGVEAGARVNIVVEDLREYREQLAAQAIEELAPEDWEVIVAMLERRKQDRQRKEQ